MPTALRILGGFCTTPLPGAQGTGWQPGLLLHLGGCSPASPLFPQHPIPGVPSTSPKEWELYYKS